MIDNIVGGLGSVLVLLVPFLFALAWESYGLEFSMWLVEVWVKLYTVGLPLEVRERRRDEIQSDVWEQQRADVAADCSRKVVAFRILGRSLSSVPQDVSWRVGKGHLLPFRDLCRALGRRWLGHTRRDDNGQGDHVDLAGQQDPPSGRIDVFVGAVTATARVTLGAPAVSAGGIVVSPAPASTRASALPATLTVSGSVNSATPPPEGEAWPEGEA